jgi:hypothetical protein
VRERDRYCALCGTTEDLRRGKEPWHGREALLTQLVKIVVSKFRVALLKGELARASTRDRGIGVGRRTAAEAASRDTIPPSSQA